MKDRVGKGSNLNYGRKQQDFDRSVKTWKLSPEEMKRMLEGECTFEELKANKKPITYSKDYPKEIDLKTYMLLKHEGMTDSEIAAFYNIKYNQLYHKKLNWGLREMNFQQTAKRGVGDE